MIYDFTKKSQSDRLRCSISLSYSYSLTTFCWRVNVVSFLAGVFNFLVDAMMRAF